MYMNIRFKYKMYKTNAINKWMDLLWGSLLDSTPTCIHDVFVLFIPRNKTKFEL